MKRVFFILTAVIIASSSIHAQEKLSKKERKEQETMLKEAQKQEQLDLIYSRFFVLEATKVQTGTGQILMLTPTTNFLSVMNDKASIQFALDGMIGWNGLGGMTLDGSISQFKVNEGKTGKYFTVTIRVSGAGMYSHQFLTVWPDGHGELEVNGDGGARFVFHGNIVPYSESRIYKGMPSNR